MKPFPSSTTIRCKHHIYTITVNGNKIFIWHILPTKSFDHRRFFVIKFFNTRPIKYSQLIVSALASLFDIKKL